MLEDEVQLFDLVNLLNLGDPAQRGRTVFIPISLVRDGTKPPRLRCESVPLQLVPRDALVSDLFDIFGGYGALCAGGGESPRQGLEGRGRVGAREGERAGLRGE